MSSLQVQPFDLVLFKGTDAIAGTIGKISIKEFTTKETTYFDPLWSHAGIVIDSNFLPGKGLTPGKLYLYESIFSGTVLGYQYSKVLPVDQPKALIKGRYAGPQVRDFQAVMDESGADVGIFPLSRETRDFVNREAEAVKNSFIKFHEKYSGFSYPFSTLPQFAAANDSMFDKIKQIKEKYNLGYNSDDESDEEEVKENVPIDIVVREDSSVDATVTRNRLAFKAKGLLSSVSSSFSSLNITSKSDGNLNSDKTISKKKTKGAVFCSELVAMIYKQVLLKEEDFKDPGRFTPIEVAAAKVFSPSFYVKKDGTSFLQNSVLTNVMMVDKKVTL
ncbi:hypothetical protein HDU92_001248 [Lobulomyces angularis]|nr:hypothetical protein HDU92_001248 [Lobulomyces angularis]